MRERSDIQNLAGHPVRVKYYVGVGPEKVGKTISIPAEGLLDAPQEVLNSSHFKALSGVTTKNQKALSVQVTLVQE